MTVRFGRRTSTLRLEPLDERALPSAAAPPVVESNGTLSVLGTDQADTIVVSDNGTGDAGAVTVAINGQVFNSVGPISQILIGAGGGADTVRYELTGDLAGARTVVADLGNQNDAFTAVVRGSILDGGNLAIKANGGNGKDTLTLDAVGVGVAASGFLSTDFNGGNGKDTLVTNYSGVLTGTASFKANGGDGKDSVGGHISLDSWVVSETNEVFQSTGLLTAVFRGGKGDDAMALTIDNATDLTFLNARLNGGHGHDTFVASSNVTIVDPLG